MLAGAGLGDDPALAEASREHGLPEGVVQLVRTGVEEVLPLQVQTLAGGEPLRPCERRRATGERSAELVQLGLEALVGLRLAPSCLELVERRDQRLRDVATTVGSVQAGRGHRAAATNARTFS